jgi:hypothetical protein
MAQKDGDILKKIRVIEWLKAELISNVAELFKVLIKGTDHTITDATVNVIIITNILARRMGVDFERIDTEVQKRLNQNIQQGHEVEKWFGDLSAYAEYLKMTKR